MRLTVLDLDKLSSNDYIGEAAFNVGELVAAAPQLLLLPPTGDGVVMSAMTVSASMLGAKATRRPQLESEWLSSHLSESRP